MRSPNSPSSNPQIVQVILVLRQCGFSITTLSLMYGWDKSMIRWYQKKFGIPVPDQEISINDAVRRVLEENLEDRWVVVDGERINKGYSYSEYLKRIPPRVA